MEKQLLNKKWWHETIGYQIYPKSFQDSNNDGVGDIQGMIQHLDELQELGVNVVWISPINLSPMVDHGYDISDYFQIDPSFGTNEDFEELIQEANKRGIKILMDLVINHTSDQHEWFKEALANPNSDFRNYYVIKEGKDGLPPNNWRSIFGGSAWEQIEDTNEYYLHLFTKGQPDLNWENPMLREELYQMIQYWLDRGLGGFRIDAITHIKKNYDYINVPADGPDNLATVWEHYRDATGIGEFLGEMRDRVFTDNDVLTIAEMDVEDPDKWEEYFGENGYFSTIFDFYHTPYSIQQEKYKEHPVTFIEDMKTKMFAKQVKANGRVLFTNFLENHDLPRALNRWIPESEIHFNSASALAMMYFFLRGIPVIYQGQEIGMVDYPKDSIEEYLDLPTYNNYENYLLEGLSEDEALHQINIECRENSRTPVQWDASEYAGFSTVKPWFDVNPNYHDINYAQQKDDPHSLLNFYKKMAVLRKNKAYQETFIYSDTVPFATEIKGCVAYERQGIESIFVICNMTNQPMQVPVASVEEILLTNGETDIYVDGYLHLKPYQGIIFK
ncbi:alpha-glucosidase [Candidatus Enterococcus willemsii]|uniref:alpha-glucosidase n=1 Tax=Candidatus Enterococcus willemsii TaxID=1857215 RepID=UPI00137A53EB|nr:alpha-glucosidase [Enterococcus sp. CU12B]